MHGVLMSPDCMLAEPNIMNNFALLQPHKLQRTYTIITVHLQQKNHLNPFAWVLQIEKTRKNKTCMPPPRTCKAKKNMHKQEIKENC